jgi:hypothetical protein
MLLKKLQDMRLTHSTRAYALGGMQATRKQIDEFNPQCRRIEVRHFKAYLARRRLLPVKLKILHVASAAT